MPAVYVAACAQLDAAYEYPNTATKTLRSLPLVDNLPQDDTGRVYVAIPSVYCDYDLPSVLLPQLIDAGLVEEIAEEQFAAVLPPMQPA